MRRITISPAVLVCLEEKQPKTRILNKFRQFISRATMSTHAKNQLQHEKSPYLLQHQSNPVDWHPWSPATHSLAVSKNKPIFLSVGYSTCHWCHVMEKESFENSTIADIMNQHFINIKIDREEMPDIDRIYMTFVQAISGSGGWPMSVWLTPDLKPFYGGTYYPPEDRYYGRPGFKALLLTIAEQWNDNSSKFTESSQKIMKELEKTTRKSVNDTMPDVQEVVPKCLQQLQRSYEPIYGGFGGEAPKFPQPSNLYFLIDYCGKKSASDEKVVGVMKQIEKTLKFMIKGGIHDHVGQGFARYSTDKKWHVPHFEKMLYDQAQLAFAYSNAYIVSGGDKLYDDIVRDILTYVGRDLSHEEGGFYCAEDADSLPTFDSKEKSEGAFYAWSKPNELDTIFKDKHLNNNPWIDIFSFAYGVKENGNVSENADPHGELKGQNVLFEAHTVQETAEKFGCDVNDVKEALNEMRVTLFNYRNVNRPRPGLDTKFVTSWNGLMIQGYVKAGIALSSKEYIDRAVKAVEFAKKYVIVDGNDLLRTCYLNIEDNKSIVNVDHPIRACVDDFSNFIAALIDVWQATFDTKYLKMAIDFQKTQDDLFWDDVGGYFNSRANDPAVILRMKDDDDGAEPSSNSTSLLNLFRLYTVTNNSAYSAKIDKILLQFADRLSKLPITLPLMSAVLDTIHNNANPNIITLLGKSVTMTSDDALIAHLRKKYLPIGSVVIGIDIDKQCDLVQYKADLQEKIDKCKSEGKTVIYIKKKGQEIYVTNVAELDEAFNQ